MLVSKGKAKITLQILFEDETTDADIDIDNRELKIILYKPDDSREEINLENPGDVVDFTEVINGVNVTRKYMKWNDPDYDFDQTGLWEYAGFADSESPYRNSFWVT